MPNLVARSFILWQAIRFGVHSNHSALKWTHHWSLLLLWRVIAVLWYYSLYFILRYHIYSSLYFDIKCDVNMYNPMISDKWWCHRVLYCFASVYVRFFWSHMMCKYRTAGNDTIGMPASKMVVLCPWLRNSIGRCCI